MSINKEESVGKSQVIIEEKVKGQKEMRISQEIIKEEMEDKEEEAEKEKEL